MDAPIEKVWNAISTSDTLASWLMPNNFKLEMGYEFTFRSVPQNGLDGIVHCKVMEIVAPSFFQCLYFCIHYKLLYDK